MTLYEAIKKFEEDLPDLRANMNGPHEARNLWMWEDIEAVTVLLDAVRMRPASEPPDTERDVLAKCDYGSHFYYAVARYDASSDWWSERQEGCHVDVVSWRELPE